MKTDALVTGVLGLLLMSGCGTGQSEVQREQSGGAEYVRLATAKYGNAAEYVFNASRTAVLCLKKYKPTALAPQHRIEFFVYDIRTKKKVFEDELVDGSVEWKDDHAVLVQLTPGMARIDQQTIGYTVDIRDGRRKSLNGAEAQ